MHLSYSRKTAYLPNRCSERRKAVWFVLPTEQCFSINQERFCVGERFWHKQSIYSFCLSTWVQFTLKQTHYTNDKVSIVIQQESNVYLACDVFCPYDGKSKGKEQAPLMLRPKSWGDVFNRVANEVSAKIIVSVFPESPVNANKFSCCKTQIPVLLPASGVLRQGCVALWAELQQ